MVRVPRKLTIAQAAELTGLSRKALARRIERGGLPATTENGLRYLDSRDLARAGLLDLSTGKSAAWSTRIDPDAVARELVRTLIDQGIELYELRAELDAFAEESRRNDERHTKLLREARREREAIKRKLEQMDADRAELRQQIERRPNQKRS